MGNQTIAFCQGVHNSLFMLMAVFPDVQLPGVFSAPCVSNIEYILDLWIIAFVINEGNALGTPANKTVHGFVPQFIVCAGGSLRPLGVDHQLFMVWVLIKPCCGSKKVCPVLIAADDPGGGGICQLCIEL